MKLYFLCPKITTIPYYNIYSIHSSRKMAENMRSRLMYSERCCVISGDYEFEFEQGRHIIWYVDVTEKHGLSYTLFDSLCDSREKAYNYITLLPPEIRKKAHIHCWHLGIFEWKCELNYKWDTSV